MGSSGDSSGSSAGLLALLNQGTPNPALPIAGSANATGDPYEYGKFQNFLPDPVAGQPNQMAHGLTPDMFQYRKPNPAGGSGSGDSGGADLRTQLAAVMGAGAGGGGGAPGTPGGMFGRGPPSNGVGPPPGATQLPTPPGGWAPGNVPGWPAGGPGTPIVRPGDNSDPAAAAAALAAAKASGG